MTTDLAASVLSWYRVHGRHSLPWQRDPGPYRVWVSEIMLQQTRVSTVIPYFERFMARFPDVCALADADPDEVLSLWSGLGYYARARNMHRAAVILRDEYGGRFPESLEEVMALPGIGRSTAGAILALSRGERHPILDGNVKRVLARYHGIDGWPGQPAVERRLWDLAERHLPERELAAYTQGMMDLGASLCSPRRPACLLCPLERDCISRLDGRAEQRPGRKPRRERPTRRVRMMLAVAEGRVLLERRPPSGVWGGLWAFPEVSMEQDAEPWARERFGLWPRRVRRWPLFHHGFTHFRLEIEPLELHLERLPGTVAEAERAWLTPAEAAHRGLAAPVSRLLERLDLAGRGAT